ncbi:MAG: ABC transporter permease [Paenibacillus macerans]|uniref:Binding--dependent transport system inner membrane component family protein n=2 Tax=Paenibacillus macerans TaxID=44252 RepID=A0A090ZK73_PAEMA|nr:ABC transporter permease [Paenibacillus macerans]KFN11027.1 binding--dependent transport system inner membrane component family protein [Paenibacillus macerans]MCY7562854.1 ABC transporter permease [Paenibacillus macerans]MDU7476569.1 ABC transporter permease [Paenibacillus macerans]MEC0152209.1 ABC transporter permease [Paenibacillus macerans]MED4959137.1 ABC transporter permease [Paenibacillus macerans]
MQADVTRLPDRERWLREKWNQHRKQKRKMKRMVLAVQIFLLLLLIGWWELAGRMKWIDVLIFSYPSKVARQIFKDAASGELWPHLAMTVGETAVGFLLGTLLGTLLAVLIWWSPFLSKVLDPYMVVFNSMPKVALGPIFIVMFGAGFTAIVVTTLSITVIVTTLVVFNSFNEVDANLVKVIRTFGGNRRDVFMKAILPASFPTIVSTLKVNVGMAWVGVIVGEFLVAKIGLGYLIVYGFQVFNFTLVLSSLVIIAVVATAMYQLVVYIERKLVRER